MPTTLNFPSNPTLNQTYSFGGKTWIWTGQAWRLSPQGAINGIVIGNTSPSTGAFTILTASLLAAGPATFSGNIVGPNLSVAHSIIAETVSASGNVTGNYFIGNGSQLTGVIATGIAGNLVGNLNTGTYNLFSSNGAVLVNDTLSVTGNIITSGEVLTSGPIATTANVTANYFIGDGSQLTNLPAGNYSNANVAAYLPTYTGNISAGNVTTTGNISGSYVLGNGSQLTGISTSLSGNLAGNIDTLEYSINSSNGEVRFGNSISVIGNAIITDNLLVGDQVVTTGNVTGNYFIGDGSRLTNLPAGNYSNANVAAYLPTYTGNVSAANVSANYFLGNGSQLTGITTSLSGNLAGNINTGPYSLYSANGAVKINDALSVTGNITTASGLVAAGGIATTGNITTTANVVADYFVGNFTGNISGNLVVPGSNTQVVFNTNGSADATSGLTFNKTSNVLTVGGNVSAVGNVSGAYILGNGSQLTGLPALYGNANVADYLAVYTGNISAGNVSATSNISADNVVANVLSGNTANILGNITTSGNVSAQYFVGNFAGNISGNLTVPGANTQVIFNTDGSADATSGLTFNKISNVLTVIGNVSAVGNISGNYILGNGSQLTGIDATSIQSGNSNVRVTANSNVTVSVGGTANVAVFATTGQYITGLVSVTGNVTTSNVNSASTLTLASGSDGNILLSANGSGIVKITGTTGFVVPVGNTAQRPSPSDTGTLRLNSTLNGLEVYTSGSWQLVGAAATGNTTITDQQIAPDGTNVSYTLNQVATSPSIMVAINGVTQTPDSGYSVVGNIITFAEAPLVSDAIDVRFLTAPAATPGVLYNSGANSSVQVNDVPEISFTVNNGVRTKITANGIVDISTGRSIKMPLYTVAQADALTGRTEGEMIYVQNGDSGAACLAVFTSGVWKRVVLGSAISG